MLSYLLLAPGNGWWDVSATLAVINIIGAILSAVVTALLVNNKMQNNRIETLVNGNLHKEQTETARLRGLLETHGIDHNPGAAPDAKA